MEPLDIGGGFHQGAELAFIAESIRFPSPLMDPVGSFHQG